LRIIFIYLEFEKIKATAYAFWKTGSPTAEWIEITEEDKKIELPQFNQDSKVHKEPYKTGLIKAGTRFQKKV
jgi:hypothetical protein